MIDEATAALKIDTESMPAELDQLKRKITQMEIELAALKKDKTAKERAKQLEAEISKKKEQAKVLEARWRQQKDLIEKIQKVRAEIDELRNQLEKYEREVELEKASEIKYGKLPEKQKELEKLEAELQKIPEEERLIREQVTAEDVARVVSRWTGIPVRRLLASESERLVHLEDELHKRVVDQEEAIHQIANAIRRSRTGLAEENRPIGSFLFLGPTGVGKTETAKALAEVMFDKEDAMIRIDLSEYQEAHTVARLIGSPPGYVGYEEGGQLTEAVRRRPYSVVLFDEVEKAHPQVFNIFLQILDDGRLTDGKGRTVNFKNTVIIMTSNLGANLIQKAAEEGKKMAEIKDQVMEVVKQNFRPEFINRLDQIVLFEPLNQELLEKIVELQLDKVRQRLQHQQIGLELDQKARKLLVEKGYDPAFGARPLKRVIQSEIVDEIAMMLLEGKVKPGQTVFVTVNKQGKFEFKAK